MLVSKRRAQGTVKAGRRAFAKTPSDKLRSQSCIGGGCPQRDPIPTSSARWDFGASDTTSKPCRRTAGIRLRQSTPRVPRPSRWLSTRSFPGKTHYDEIEAACAEIKAAAAIKAAYYDVKEAIGQALLSTKPHLIYFFCHGGRTKKMPWLGVGKNDRRSMEPISTHGARGGRRPALS